MSSKIRVLIVAANLKIAGAQKMIEQLVLHLNQQKYDVKLLVLSEKKGTIIEKRLESAAIDIKYLYKPAGFHPFFFFKVRKEILEFKPQLIHTHVNSWIYVLPSVILSRIKMLHTIHSSPERQESHWILRVIIRWLYKKGFAIPVAISDQIRKDAVNIYQIPLHKIEVIYNPVDYETFSTQEKVAHKGTVFVNVARFNFIKNHEVLIRAFADVYQHMPFTRLILAGDGELLEPMQQLVHRLLLDKAVVFLGNVTNVPLLLSKCDVFVLPSKSEGMPVSLLEAEAAGLPIIASRVGGIPDVVKNNGILVTANKVEELAEAMEYMAEHAESCRQMGKKSQDIAKKYSADIIARKYENLYQKYGAEE